MNSAQAKAGRESGKEEATSERRGEGERRGKGKKDGDSPHEESQCTISVHGAAAECDIVQPAGLS
jgi:hypothetical protein